MASGAASGPSRKAATERGDNSEIIVLTGDLPKPSLRPVGKIFVLKDGRRCFAGDADASIIEQWEQIKTTALSTWPNIHSASLANLFHRTSTKARLNLWRCSFQAGSFVTSGFSFDRMAAPNGMCVRR
jgi:hypothetical protein